VHESGGRAGIVDCSTELAIRQVEQTKPEETIGRKSACVTPTSEPVSDDDDVNWFNSDVDVNDKSIGRVTRRTRRPAYLHLYISRIYTRKCSLQSAGAMKRPLKQERTRPSERRCVPDEEQPVRSRLDDSVASTELELPPANRTDVMRCTVVEASNVSPRWHPDSDDISVGAEGAHEPRV